MLGHRFFNQFTRNAFILEHSTIELYVSSSLKTQEELIPPVMLCLHIHEAEMIMKMEAILGIERYKYIRNIASRRKIE